MTTLSDGPDLAPPTRARPAPGAPGAASGPEGPDALIKEARRLRRRRYFTIGAVLVVVVGGTAAGLALSHGGGQGHTGGTHPRAAPTGPKVAPPASPTRPPGTVLPSSALFNQITVTPDGLLLTGQTAAAANNTAGSVTGCAAASVNPQSLAVAKPTVGNCDDPLLYGQTVEVVNTHVPLSNNDTVSVNTADPATGQVSDGPAVMTFSSGSDTQPVIAYGSQWIWIYDVDTTSGPELLQVSAHSGALDRTIAMPRLYRPLLAADDGGVWVANSLEGSPTTALSYVTTGSSAPSVVIADTNRFVCSLLASGTSAWITISASVGSGCVHQVVERFSDGSTEPVFTSPGPELPLVVIGNEADGLWAMAYSTPSKEEIIHIDPNTGASSVVATVPAVPIPSYLTNGGLAPGQAVYFDGSLYLLEPPFHVRGYLGYTSLVRVVVPPNG